MDLVTYDQFTLNATDLEAEAPYLYDDMDDICFVHTLNPRALILVTDATSLPECRHHEDLSLTINQVPDRLIQSFLRELHNHKFGNNDKLSRI